MAYDGCPISIGQKNIHWDDLVNGVTNAKGVITRPAVVIPESEKTGEVYGYVNNIFYSDQESGVINGGRYNYYQQLYNK